MTLTEKLSLLGGRDMFYTKAVERLDIPSIRMSDASVGIRPVEGDNPCQSVAYPATLALAASWNPHLANQAGQSLAQDARAYGIQVLLGPGVNLYRAPMCGRNAEYMGEDPFLTGKTASAFIQGMQKQGIAAVVKHFAANNLEYDRYISSSDIDERTLREIYLRPFEMAVKEADVAAVMTSYNRLNGTYTSHNEYLIRKILKQQWGFGGVVMSDWWSVHDGLAAVLAGLDLEMPDAKYMNPEMIQKHLDSGLLDEAIIDDKVRRILTLYERFGFFDPDKRKPSQNYDIQQSRNTALQVAREGFVLLKNEDILPLSLDSVKSIAVLGPNSHPAVTGCGGSSFVAPEHPVSVLDGIRAIASEETTIFWNDMLEFKGRQVQSIDWSGQESLSYLDKIAVIAGKCDIVALCVGFNDGALYEGEAADRPFELHENCRNLIRIVSKVNPNLVVLLMAGGNADIGSWQHRAKAILHVWYPGQEGGQAAAEILFGRVNPSGKLPMTIEKKWEDSPAFDAYYDSELTHHVRYKEGLFVGYRHYDRKDIEPLYPFGFGLSYTAFSYDNLEIKTDGQSITAAFSITNSGKVEGAEVAQLYVKKEQSSIVRAEKELKGYAKVHLKPGETRQVQITLSKSDLAYFDTVTGEWQIEPGEYRLMIASHSRQVHLDGTIRI